MSAVPVKEPFRPSPLPARGPARRPAPSARRVPDVLDECVAEFTRRLRACVARPDDDEHFWARVVADIDALKARCQPQDAFAFELKAARVLAEYGFTTWPESLRSSAHPPTGTTAGPALSPIVVGQETSSGRPANRAS